MPIKDHSNQCSDIVIIYQDRYKIEQTVTELQALNLSFKLIRMNKKNDSRIIGCHAKLILLSCHHLITAIEYYLGFLSKNQGALINHCTIALVNDFEAEQAFSACYEGLFDDFVTIIPSFNTQRLKLSVVQSLKLQQERQLIQTSQKLSDKDNDKVKIKNKAYSNNLMKQIQTQFEQQQLTLNEQLENLVADEDTYKTISQQVELSSTTLIKKIHNHVGKHIPRISAEVEKDTLKGIANNKRFENRLNYNFHPKSSKQDIKRHTEPTYKIMIAESSMLFANTIAEVFEDMNFQVRVTVDGKQTLQAVNDFQPDIILIENNLSQINGINVTRKIRNNGSCVPIIVIVEDNNKALLKQWIPLGISTYINKSSDPDNILDTVLNELLNPSGLLKFKTVDHIDQIQWLPEYSVGHELMDSHHKKLFSLIKHFIDSDRTQQQPRDIFTQLKLYIAMHFKAEAKLLKKHHYPNYEQHIKEHKTLIQNVTNMEKKLSIYDKDIRKKIGFFLYKWLNKHILKTNTEYRSYLTTAQNLQKKKALMLN